MKRVFLKLGAGLLAMMMIVGLLVGCSDGDEKGKVVTLAWYLPGGVSQDDAIVFEEANKYIKEKLGVELKLNFIDSGNFEKKIQVMNASNDEYDIVFTSNWLNNYYTCIQNDLLLPLDDLLKNEAPKLYKLYDEKVWDGVRVNGKIYGIMNQQIFARSSGVYIPVQNLKATGYKIEDFKTLDDLTPYLKKVSELTGSRTYGRTSWQAYVQAAGLEEIVGSGLPGAIYYNKQGKIKVVNQFETPEFKHFIDTVAQWRKDGIQHEEILFDDSKNVRLNEDISPVPFVMPATYTPGTKETYKRDYGVDMEYAPFSEPLMTSYGVAATLQSINSLSKHPVEAIKVLELINTDPVLYNLLVCGIEGRNYKKADNGAIEFTPNNVYAKADWVMGNTFLKYLTSDMPQDLHEQVKAVNENAGFSPAYGFTPDLTKYSVQVSNCKSVIGEYLQTLEQGVVDSDSTYKVFIDKLKAAEVDVIITELQRQMDEWCATSK